MWMRAPVGNADTSDPGISELPIVTRKALPYKVASWSCASISLAFSSGSGNHVVDRNVVHCVNLKGVFAGKQGAA